MIALHPSSYQTAAAPLAEVPFNTIFAQAVVDGHQPGQIYVDRPDEPTVWYVCHAYGMSLLFGNAGADAFNQRLAAYMLNQDGSRQGPEWLQASPEAWPEKLAALLGADLGRQVAVNTRVNFQFDRGLFLASRDEPAGEEGEIVKLDETIYRSMQGSVVPACFWRSYQDFARLGGAGFSLLCDGEVACTAFSSFRRDGILELGIETVDRYRGRGFALRVCRALIEHCLANSLEPVWACRLENTGSYRLARKLGFVPTRHLPYYRLVS